MSGQLFSWSIQLQDILEEKQADFYINAKNAVGVWIKIVFISYVSGYIQTKKL